MPGYSQWTSGVLNPALEATQRSMAAQGKTFSGQEMADLTAKGQQGYYNFMQDYMNRLAQGSGATQSPVAGAELQYRADAASDQAQGQMIGGLISGLGWLLGQ